MLATEPPIEPSSTYKIINAGPVIADSTTAERSSSPRAEQAASAEPPQPTEQTATA